MLDTLDAFGGDMDEPRREAWAHVRFYRVYRDIAADPLLVNIPCSVIRFWT